MSTLSDWRAEALAQLTERGISPEDAQEDLTWLLVTLARISRAQQLTEPHRPLSNEQLTLLSEALARRASREPVSQILGCWSFWGLDFQVNRAVLTPRPDTEVLVEEALKWLASATSKQPDKGQLVVDVCSGTGCVGLSISSERSCPVILIELCEEASAVLKLNAEALDAQGALQGRVELRRGHLLEPLKRHERPTLIVSNPPYIETAELTLLMPEVRDFEPHLALDGGVDGLDLVRELVQSSAQRLAPGGALMMEVGWKQTAQVSALFQEAGFSAVRVKRDYGGNPRVVIGALA